MNFKRNYISHCVLKTFVEILINVDKLATSCSPRDCHSYNYTLNLFFALKHLTYCYVNYLTYFTFLEMAICLQQSNFKKADSIKI